MYNSQELDKYIIENSSPEGDFLHALYRATNAELLHGRMASGAIQGRFLKMLVQLKQPKNVLEIGTFSGYSALSMAEAMPKDGKIWSFEINDEIEDFTKKWINKSPYANKINMIIGNAITEAPKLGVKFDMVFIDGDKRTYVEAYEMAMQNTTKDALIIADNTLWDGHVVEEKYNKDPQTQGVKRFNAFVAQDKRVEKVILPLRDGLTLIYKTKENA